MSRTNLLVGFINVLASSEDFVSCAHRRCFHHVLYSFVNSLIRHKRVPGSIGLLRGLVAGVDCGGTMRCFSFGGWGAGGRRRIFLG